MNTNILNLIHSFISKIILLLLQFKLKMITFRYLFKYLFALIYVVVIQKLQVKLKLITAELNIGKPRLFSKIATTKSPLLILSKGLFNVLFKKRLVNNHFLHYSTILTLNSDKVNSFFLLTQVN